MTTGSNKKVNVSEIESSFDPAEYKDFDGCKRVVHWLTCELCSCSGRLVATNLAPDNVHFIGMVLMLDGSKIVENTFVCEVLSSWEKLAVEACKNSGKSVFEEIGKLSTHMMYASHIDAAR